MYCGYVGRFVGQYCLMIATIKIDLRLNYLRFSFVGLFSDFGAGAGSPLLSTALSGNSKRLFLMSAPRLGMTSMPVRSANSFKVMISVVPFSLLAE